MITIELARKLIAIQFPEYSDLPVKEIEKQGHDNRTYRLGENMLIRMPRAKPYALKVAKEQELLSQLAQYLNVAIPIPIKMGSPSADYPYPFSIYKWIEGKSANHLKLDAEELESIAAQLAAFLNQLQNIQGIDELEPGQHNWWRGAHLSVYDKGAREQIADLSNIIDSNAALALWENACSTKWQEKPVWIHGDVAVGNILIKYNKLAGIIDFGGMAIGDPACDLVIAWTYLSNKAREIFMDAMNLDINTWMRARGWVLWKATFELCQIKEKNSNEALFQQSIINDVLIS